MDTFEESFEKTRALVFGVGGCGDIVSTIPTARLLETHGVEVILGGVAWERAVVDPQPGPRHFDDIEGIEQLNGSVAIATGQTQTSDGIEFAETKVARHYQDDVLLIDIGGGAAGVRTGIDDACDRLDIGFVVGIDAGGDVIAMGDEPGIKSPLTDAVMLSALSSLEADSALGVFGYGSDGELTHEELERAFAAAAQRAGFLGAWGLTPRVVDELDSLLNLITTEASRLPVEVAHGNFEADTIRDGARSVELSPASAVTFYFDPVDVAKGSDLEEYVHGTDSFESAHQALVDAGFETELELEQSIVNDV